MILTTFFSFFVWKKMIFSQTWLRRLIVSRSQLKKPVHSPVHSFTCVGCPDKDVRLVPSNQKIETCFRYHLWPWHILPHIMALTQKGTWTCRHQSWWADATFKFIPRCAMGLTSGDCVGRIKLVVISHSCIVMLSYFLCPEPTDIYHVHLPRAATHITNIFRLPPSKSHATPQLWY